MIIVGCMEDIATESAPERPSKSAQKRESHALQKLGADLLTLPANRLAGIAMPDALREALAEYQRTRSHEGRRRHLQLIGKLMRQADPEPLQEAVADFRLGRAQDSLALHQAETWRDALLAGDEALTRWLSEHPGSDTQHLRSLVRAARKDAQSQAAHEPAQRHGRAYRDLFQWLKEALKS